MQFQFAPISWQVITNIGDSYVQFGYRRLQAWSLCIEINFQTHT
jgi:hypothetical protein